MEQWKINTMAAYLEQIKALKKNSVYLTSITERKALASLYAQILAIGDGFPQRKGFSSNIVKTLKKKVNNTCPSCVKEKVMKSVIDSAVQSLKYYAVLIENEVSDIDSSNTSVHDLKPN